MTDADIRVAVMKLMFQLDVDFGYATGNLNKDTTPDNHYEIMSILTDAILNATAKAEKAHDHTRLQELLEALPEKQVKQAEFTDSEFVQTSGWCYTCCTVENSSTAKCQCDVFNEAIDRMTATIKQVYGGVL